MSASAGKRRRCVCDVDRNGTPIYSPLAGCEIHGATWDEVWAHRIWYPTAEDARRTHEARVAEDF